MRLNDAYANLMKKAQNELTNERSFVLLNRTFGKLGNDKIINLKLGDAALRFGFLFGEYMKCLKKCGPL